MRRKPLNKVEIAVLNALNKVDKPTRAMDLNIDKDIKVNIQTIGKTSDNLRKRGLTTSIKEGHYKVWSITDAGIDALIASNLQAQNGAGADVDVESVVDTTGTSGTIDTPDHDVNADGGTILLSGYDAPPVMPDHFIFVVSDDKLASMLSSRIGVDKDEIKLLKARIATLEECIVQNNRMIKSLKKDRDAAMRLASEAERKYSEMIRIARLMDKVVGIDKA